MKKYEKPSILVERFEITQHIASCGSIVVNATGVDCVLNSPGAPDEMKDLANQGYFMDTVVCLDVATDGEICYNASVNTVFQS